MSIAENKRVVEGLWKTLYTRNWDELAGLLAEDAHYEDVPTPDPGARGPANIVKRLRIGLDPIDRFEHHPHRMVAEGDSVAIEAHSAGKTFRGDQYAQEYHFVMRARDGKITEWKEYMDTEHARKVLVGE